MKSVHFRSPVSGLPVRRISTLTLLVAAITCAAYADELDFRVGGTGRDTVNPTQPRDIIAPVELVFGATRPAFTYEISRLNGVLTAPGQPASSTVQTAGVLLHWDPSEWFSLRYRPAWHAYSNSDLEDNFSHELNLRANAKFGDWAFLLTHRYFSASAPLIEVGRQTAQQVHDTMLQAVRQLGLRTSLELGLRQSLLFAEDLPGHGDWSSQNWLHYVVSSVFTTSVGYTYGFVQVEDGADMTYHQIRARLRWQLTEKINFDFRGGVEARDVEDQATEDIAIYGGVLTYRILDTTQLTVGCDKRVTPSLLESLMSESTTWRISLDQRLFEHLRLEAQWIHRTNNYDSISGQPISVRDDSGTGFQVLLSTNIRARGSIAVGYQRTENHSSDSAYNLCADMYVFRAGLFY